MPGTKEPIDAKHHKAQRYTNEPDRFRVDAFRVTMKSEHGDRVIGFETGVWSCTCDFFAGYRTCSHVMALDLILGEQAGLQLRDDSRE
ncbi:MAG: hypothetical protein ACRDS9_15135 [Pseudonocardiaceae bacterium]